MKKMWLYNAMIFALCAGIFVAPLQAEMKFTKGGALRVRHEYWKNTADVSNTSADDRSFFRFKTSLWAQTDLSSLFSVYVKLTNENRSYIYFDPNGNTTYDIHEAVFDNLYVDIKNPMGHPVSFRLGRQELASAIYGEGFIFGDGTPSDGSRTYYFDAAKVNWRINDAQNLDIVYIKSDRYDTFLPVMNEIKGGQLLNMSREEAAVLYHRADVNKAFHWENYYVWKYEAPGNSIPSFTPGDFWLNTLGSYGKYTIDPLTFRGQVAYQFDSRGTDVRQAFGGYLFADAALKKLMWTPGMTLGYVHLSGDDRTTAKVEAWDPLFSRYPWISDAIAMLYAKESGSAYWTNLKMVRAGISFNPVKNTKVSAYYNLLSADTPMTGGIFGGGTDRGRLTQGRVDYTFNKYVCSYFAAEYFAPGDFYKANTNRDEEIFTRAEVQIKF